MKKLLVTLTLLFLLFGTVQAQGDSDIPDIFLPIYQMILNQSDVNGDPDIFLPIDPFIKGKPPWKKQDPVPDPKKKVDPIDDGPSFDPIVKNIYSQVDPDEAMPYISPMSTVDMVVYVLPNCLITYAVDPDIDIADIWLPTPLMSDPDASFPDIFLPSTSDGNSAPGGQMTPPPPCGYKGTVDDPTKSGCDYVTFNGTDKDGNSFSVCAQVYFPKGTPTAEKAQEITNELNRQSDNTTNDPIVAQSAPSKGTFVVQPAAGGKITSAEWDNGSGEEDNTLDEMNSPDKANTSGSKLNGIPSGMTSDGEASFIMMGFGRWKVFTFIEPFEQHVTILSRLEYGLTFMGLRAKIGYDTQTLENWLVFDNPFYRMRMGCNDTGLNPKNVSDSETPSLTPKSEGVQTVKVGRYEISLF